MNIFMLLSLIGGLSLFLFGMNVMGQALERRAGSGLKTILGRLTGKPAAGLLTGLCVTAVIQSSSATTVMVIGFVNSGLMTLRESIYVIMGANIGTTVTAWILSLTGISSSNLFVSLLKPSSFTPVLALIGIICYMFLKNEKKRDTGLILLGFATLMFGMETMSSSVAGLAELPEFRRLFLLFHNPILGVLAGALLTALIQSSSASVGILQALASTGAVTYGAAVPIIMGQNIGTCATAMISSVGATRNARRAAVVHLCFNVIGTIVWLLVFTLIRSLLSPEILTVSATLPGIAVIHSAFNLLCTLLMLPFAGFLEKLCCFLVPEDQKEQEQNELDQRFLKAPTLALGQCRLLIEKMMGDASEALNLSLRSLDRLTPEAARRIRHLESRTDHYEDIIGTYLIRLSGRKLSPDESMNSAQDLKLIGDLERIADHSLNILESAEEMDRKGIHFTAPARGELRILSEAVLEITALSHAAFSGNNLETAYRVEPLEQVIDLLKEEIRTRHIHRLQEGICSIEAGFVLSDLLTDLERISDHCSNIAAGVIDSSQRSLAFHETLTGYRNSGESFEREFRKFRSKYDPEEAPTSQKCTE